MLLKQVESTEVDDKIWLRVTSGTCGSHAVTLTKWLKLTWILLLLWIRLLKSVLNIRISSTEPYSVIFSQAEGYSKSIVR